MFRAIIFDSFFQLSKSSNHPFLKGITTISIQKGTILITLIFKETERFFKPLYKTRSCIIKSDLGFLG